MDPFSSRRQDGYRGTDRPMRTHGTAIKSTTSRNSKSQSGSSLPDLSDPHVLENRASNNTARKTGNKQQPHKAPETSDASRRAYMQGSREVPATPVLRATKQSSGQARPAGAKQPSIARDGGNDNIQRKVARKMASVESASQRRPQSNFTYIAPLPRGSAAMSKSTPTKPLYLAMQDKENLRTPRKKVDDDGFGSRNAPRISIGAMSVQRRPGVSPRKAEVPRSAHAGRQHAPATRQAVNVIPSSSSDGSGSSDESDIAPRVRLPKAARKTAPNAQPYAAKAARKRSSDTEGLVRSLGKAARKLNISSEIDDNSVIELSDEDEDIDDLLNAFDALTLGLTRLRRKRRLPYLRRNLRRGFEDRCARAGVPTTIIENPDAPVKVVYRFYPRGDHRDETDDSGSEEECQEWVGTVTKWICPLCPLYDPFNNRAMLAHHLSRDHDEVKASWEQIHIRNKLRWRITLVLPHYDTQGPEDSTSDNSSLDSDTDQDVKPEGTDDDAEESTSRPGSPSSSANISAPPRPPLFLPDSDEEGFPASAIPQQEQVPEEIKPIVVRRESETPEPPKPLSFSVNTTQQPESRAPTAAVVSYRGSLPARYPSPPPPDDPMGPAARFPYLPQTDDENRARYSCRIGGPRIYDLLNELSLEEFGIMSWAVVDREEELFEMDDVRDEDKVMLALWNRWIMLNKTRFIFDQYDKGVRAFIDQYWQLIHRAAGWRALRAFLMMLQVHRYLTIAGVVQILKYYEGKTGMKFWYQEAQEEAS